MSKPRASSTAEGMALLRAIESQKPEDVRICYDPIARSLANGFSFTMSKLVIDSGLYERMAPGAVAFISARERYIDDFLKKCIEEGFEQVVLLGAGYDTRPYRILGIEKTRVFEIDTAATQQAKLAKLKQVIDPIPSYVTYLPVDFNSQSLKECLLSGGYDEKAKTLYIWQGVVVYLTQKGVDRTLAFIANHSGEGSAVIFDYFYTETLRDTSRPEVRAMHKAAKVTREDYLFGIDKGKINQFLRQRGFHEVRNVTSDDLHRLYFHGKNAKRILPNGCDIVSASVAKSV